MLALAVSGLKSATKKVVRLQQALMIDKTTLNAAEILWNEKLEMCTQPSKTSWQLTEQQHSKQQLLPNSQNSYCLQGCSGLLPEKNVAI